MSGFTFRLAWIRFYSFISSTPENGTLIETADFSKYLFVPHRPRLSCMAVDEIDKLYVHSCVRTAQRAKVNVVLSTAVVGGTLCNLPTAMRICHEY